MRLLIGLLLIGALLYLLFHTILIPVVARVDSAAALGASAYTVTVPAVASSTPRGEYIDDDLSSCSWGGYGATDGPCAYQR